MIPRYLRGSIEWVLKMCMEIVVGSAMGYLSIQWISFANSVSFKFVHDWNVELRSECVGLPFSCGDRIHSARHFSRENSIQSICVCFP
jgi:hypothetical protein